MVGNDVVDLNDPDANPDTLHPRFDARVFSAGELERLRLSARPVPLRWRLWAAKEAAYKAVSKACPEIVFSPSRFHVELAPPSGAERIETAVVSCSAGRCHVTLAESDAAIHAVARFDPSGDCEAPASLSGSDGVAVSERPRRCQSLEPGCPSRQDASAVLLRGQLRVGPAGTISEDPHAPSRAVRRFSRVRLAALLGADLDALEIRRRGRIPELWLGGVRAEADLSLSHHGAVVAFACEIWPRAATAAYPKEPI